MSLHYPRIGEGATDRRGGAGFLGWVPSFGPSSPK
jgi:hypothetical protein